MAKLRVKLRNIKHKVSRSERVIQTEYLLEIGSLKLHFGQYTNQFFKPSLTNDMFEIDANKEFKTADSCKKYILKCVAKWINKNIDLSYTSVFEDSRYLVERIR